MDESGDPDKSDILVVGAYLSERVGAVHGIVEPCQFVIFDQRRGSVCIRNSEATSWYDPDGYRYGGPYP